MSKDVKKFYDEFGHVFIRDLINGNDRVNAVHALFESCVTPHAERILLIGCGAGKDAWVLAEQIAPHAQVLAVDISENNIRIAKALFSHPRIEYQIIDILEDSIDGKWQYIILPDVYEHIPMDKRLTLHRILKNYLVDDGIVLLTCPTPWHQQYLRDKNEGLQIIDEDVHLKDVQKFATDIDGFVSLYRMQSIWNTNDYFHAMLDCNKGRHTKDSTHYVPMKGTFHKGLWAKILDLKAIRKTIRKIKYKRVMKKLKTIASAPNEGTGE